MWNRLKPKIRVNNEIFFVLDFYFESDHFGQKSQLRWVSAVFLNVKYPKTHPEYNFPGIFNSKLEWKISRIIFSVHSRTSNFSKNILGIHPSFDFCLKWQILDSSNSPSPKIPIVSEVKVPQLVPAFEYGWDEPYMNNERG